MKIKTDNKKYVIKKNKKKICTYVHGKTELVQFQKLTEH